MKRLGGRYAHKYEGGTNSRGKRTLSKLHKGLDHGDIAAAFKEVEKLPKAKEK
jgi:hypothetical protein